MRILIIILISAFGFSAHARNVIKISQGNMDPLKIALLPMNSFDENLSEKIINVIKGDLERSGFFKHVARKKFLETIENSEKVPNFLLWRQINSAFLLSSDLIPAENGKIKLSFRLWDSYNEKQVAGSVMSIDKNSWRRVAHNMIQTQYP